MKPGPRVNPCCAGASLGLEGGPACPGYRPAVRARVPSLDRSQVEPAKLHALQGMRHTIAKEDHRALYVSGSEVVVRPHALHFRNSLAINKIDRGRSHHGFILTANGTGVEQARTS